MEAGMKLRDRRGLWMVSALALALTGPGVATAGAQEPTRGARERTIRVTGVGEVEVTPDEARISFAVDTSAETAQAAAEQNATTMERLIAALTAAGIPRRDIETQHYMVHPEYVHEEGMREPRIRGYRATNQVLLRTRSLERVGELIDIALRAGANRVDGVSFAVTNPSEVMAAALTEAVERARRSADAIAAALGVRVGPVLDATTSAAPPQPMMRQEMMAMGGADAAAPTQIQPGEQTVMATVSVVYAIEGGR
jgi:uncharacterized protein YggE